MSFLEMKMEYIRKPTASYMMLAQSEKPKDWEQQMIDHTGDSNILFGKCVEENGQNYLWYDITGKQSIDTLLESEELNYEMLCRILMRIYGAVECLEGMLLNAGNILLVPEGILVDYRKEEIYLCYYPGNETEIQDALKELLEYLLTKLNHEDKRAVDLAYGIYENIAKRGMSLCELKVLLRLSYEQEAGLPEEMGYEPPEEMEYEIPEEAGREPLEEGERGIPGGMRYELSKEVSVRRYGKLRQKKLSVEKSNERGLNVRLENKVKEYLRSVPKLLKTGIRRKGKRLVKEEEPFFFEPETQENVQTAHPTVLLAEITKPPEGILRYEGKGLCKDLEIVGKSFLIGSGTDCDGYIPSTTVSRKHARITRKEEIYFIEDLNSSNGTCVGGEILNYKTKMSLQKNEVVVFADEKFRFI